MRKSTSLRKPAGSGVSFIVPAYNAQTTLARCLDAIRAQVFSKTKPHEIEIIVVDDGSLDETSAVAASHGAIVIKQKNSGAARSRNQGLARASYDAVAFIDADVVISENWAEECLRTLEMPWVDCVQTPVVPDGPKSFMTTFRRDFIDYKTEGHFCYLNHAKESLPVLNSSAFMTRSSYLKNCGYSFDENLRRGEDLDFSLQLFFGGCHFALTTQAQARVYDDRSIFRYLQRSFSDGRWTYEVLSAWKINSKPSRRKTKPTFTPHLASAWFIKLNLAMTHLGLFVSTKGFFRFNSSTSKKRPPGPDHRNPFLLRVADIALLNDARLVLLSDALVLASARDLRRLTLDSQQTAVVKSLMTTTLAGGQHRPDFLSLHQPVLDLLVTHGFMSPEV